MVIGDFRPPVPDMFRALSESGVIPRDVVAPVLFAEADGTGEGMERVGDPLLVPERHHVAVLERMGLQIIVAHQRTGMPGLPSIRRLQAEAGDIIFWLDESGRAVNFGIVTAATDTYFRTVVCRPDGSKASFDINWSNLGELCTQNGMLVHLIYPVAEQMVYYFCINELGYSPAAACGVMANIYKESTFRLSARADGSYGLCQWLGDRRSSLVSWCTNNALDYTTLTGQLKYMQHELGQMKYLELDFYLMDLGNTEEDAYNAAREWCFIFEQPGDIANVARDRAIAARDELYPIYSQYGAASE